VGGVVAVVIAVVLVSGTVAGSPRPYAAFANSSVSTATGLSALA
jgi:hypothetical protein